MPDVTTARNAGGESPEPRDVAARLERAPRLPDGTGERFRGYGVVGLPLASGHVLALRRHTASSIGPAYTCVWLRDPDGRWTFYADAPPNVSCARFFGVRGRTAGPTVCAHLVRIPSQTGGHTVLEKCMVTL